jgi:hypothetical protein
MLDIDVKNFKSSELFEFYASILDELRERKIVRSSNAPLGDYCESLFCKAFNWNQHRNSKAGFDADETSSGNRYQIKGRRITKYTKTRQLGIIRQLPGKQFDFLAACLFNEDFSVRRAAIIPHELIEPYSKYSKHSNGWQFQLKENVWELRGVEDVTNQLKEARLLL